MTQVSDAVDALGAANKFQDKAGAKLGQADFLKLMVTQLKNQDPFKPMENGEFLSQMAQFASVSGIQDMQSSFSQFAASMQSSQTLQAASLVGRTVLAPGKRGYLSSDDAIGGVANLPQSVSGLAVGVYDGTGQLVRRFTLGSHTAGQVPFKWDGMMENGVRAAPGNYEIKVSAVIGGKATALGTSLYERVDSVTLGAGGQGLRLNLAGGGNIGLADVEKII